MFETRGSLTAAEAPVSGIEQSATWRPPGQVLVDHVGDATLALKAAVRAADSVHALSGEQLGSLMTEIDAARSRTEVITARLIAEAMKRGLPDARGLSARDWASRACPHLSPRHVGDVVVVAQAMNNPVHTAVAEAVTHGQVSLSRAAGVLRTLDRAAPALDPKGHEQAQNTLLQVATSPRFTDRDLKRVSDHLLSVVLSDKEHDARAKAARDLRGVHESSLGDGSLVRFIITCDPEGAAVLRTILTSPLTMPSPATDEPGSNTPAGRGDAQEYAGAGHDGEDERRDDAGATTSIAGRDTRSGTQRRYDALLTVLRRGLTGGDSIPTSPGATLMVTTAFDTLTQQLMGTGIAATGDVLSPATVRRLACEADLVPAVLGTHGEILDLGRTRRLVTPGQRRALHHRLPDRYRHPGVHPENPQR